MASPNPSPPPKYPYPIEIIVGDFIPVKLSRSTYFMWKPLMRRFIETQGMVGFINGKVLPPAEMITVPNDSSTGGTKETKNQDYLDWERSDALLRKWIIGTLEQDILESVVHLKTAKEMWQLLERGLDQPFVPHVEIVPDKEPGRDLSPYLPLHKAALTGDWKSAKKFFKKEQDAMRVFITGNSETALMVAVRSAEGINFVKKLLELMEPKDLALANCFGATALHVAAQAGNIEAAKLLVEKNPQLSNVWDISKSILPIHQAAVSARKEMVVYLLEVTEKDADPKPFEGEPGVKLVHSLIAGGLYDVALLVVQRYPNLACVDPSPLQSLALKRSAFPSGTRLHFWQRFIYSYIPTKLENFSSQSKGVDIENPVHCCVSVRQRLHAVFWKVSEILVPQIKHIREKKLMHHQALQLAEYLCLQIAKLHSSEAAKMFGYSLRRATCVGIHEVVEEILEKFPSAIFLTSSEKRQTIFHLAIVYRRENVFNLIYQTREELRHIFLTTPDALVNTGLHLAGSLEKEQKLNLRADAAGAALQMQRELQWFKEVERITLPQDREQRNTYDKTPAMLFTETHEDLVKEGEQWMKDTANSCTIVAALVATVVFAAAITVPGGNNGDSGLPIFSGKKAFIIFAISDAFALFLSTSSVLMFLSILTSRYSEYDFLYALPKRLTIGLVTLFLAIISMMIAFGVTLYIVFGEKKGWILIPITALGFIPVSLFVSLQFPLLLDMFKSTYGRGIFCKQSDRILF